jgi:hypothetical protein
MRARTSSISDADACIFMTTIMAVSLCRVSRARDALSG